MSNRPVRAQDRARIEAFLDDYRKSSYAFDRDGKPLAIEPSPIDEEMIRDHEILLGMDLPPLYRAYLLSWRLPNTDLYVGELPLIHRDDPFRGVEQESIEKIDQPFYRRNPRLIPFTYGPAQCTDLCFDIYRPDRFGDYPILAIWNNFSSYKIPVWTDLDCERSPVFASFSRYLDYLHDWLIFKATAPAGMMFEDWLRGQGKPGRSRHFRKFPWTRLSRGPIPCSDVENRGRSGRRIAMI